MIGGFSCGLAFGIMGMMVVSASIQLAPGLVALDEGAWEVETAVDDAHMTSSMALDSNGTPHIAYYHDKSLSLKYAKLTVQGWVSEFVDSRKYGGHSGTPSIVLDRNDRPHISYDLHPPSGPYVESDLRYAMWDGSGWSVQIIDTDGDVGDQSSIDLTSTGYPHIAYKRSYRGLEGIVASDVKYVRWNGSAWNIEIIEHVPGYIYVSKRSLAIDSNDLSHISYSAKVGDEYHVKYAIWNGSDWEIQVVDLVGDFAVMTSLALDSSGQPHISYYDRLDGNLRYARWNGSDWETQVVDSESDVGRVNSLDLDSKDRPHMAYSDRISTDPLDRDLKYARKVCDTWRTETVDGSSLVYFDISMALNESDHPRISYQHLRPEPDPEPFRPFDIKYAYRTVMEEPSCDVSLDIDPDTLDLKSRGRWITAYVSSENASVYDIDIPSILLQDTLSPERWDYQGDILMLKFNRQAVIAILEVGESVEIKLSGKWKDGTAFEAYDYIRVISPGRWIEHPWFSRPNPSAHS